MYRGEDWIITIKGDKEFDLDEMDFGVWLYPDRHPNALNWRGPIRKSATTGEITRIGDNLYELRLAPSVTIDVPLGRYTIEIVVFTGEYTQSVWTHRGRSIFIKQGAFAVYDSATKTIEPEVTTKP
jgi:hypothetical protein